MLIKKNIKIVILGSQYFKMRKSKDCRDCIYSGLITSKDCEYIMVPGSGGNLVSVKSLCIPGYVFCFG